MLIFALANSFEFCISQAHKMTKRQKGSYEKRFRRNSPCQVFTNLTGLLLAGLNKSWEPRAGVSSRSLCGLFTSLANDLKVDGVGFAESRKQQ